MTLLADFHMITIIGNSILCYFYIINISVSNVAIIEDRVLLVVIRLSWDIF